MDSHDHEIHECVEDFRFALFQTIHRRDDKKHREKTLNIQVQKQRRRIEKLEATLQEYQTRTFDSIPTDELSDTTISEQYSIIREHISNWVECMPDVLEFERNLEQAWLEFSQLFGDMSLAPWPIEFIGGPSVAQMELFSRTVFQGLYDAVFDPYIVGASEEHCALFSRLEQELDSLQVPKEIITSWRTNTIKAYTSCPQYTDVVEELHVAFSSNLRRFFSRFPFDDDLNMDRTFCIFQEQIMNPSLKLAQDMNHSSHRYYWDWYSGFDEESPELIYKRHLDHFIVYDIRTHNQIPRPKEDASHSEDDKPIARCLFTIYPALFRLTEGQSIRIEKATILATVLRD